MRVGRVAPEEPAAPRASKLTLARPLPLILFEGHLGFWSGAEGAAQQLTWLDGAEALVLVQLAAGPRSAAELADATGVEDDAAFRDVIAEFVRQGVVTEEVSGVEDGEPVQRFYHPDLQGWGPTCDVEPDAVDAAGIQAISTGLRRSGLIGENVLSDAFAGTHGFGIKFRREAVRTLLDWLPWSRAYFDLVLRESVARRFSATGGEDASRPNAFYFNALIVPPGSGTALHVDRTLDARTAASHVSVLYLDTVPPPGGQLFLYDGVWPVAIVHPRPGMLVHFRGSLKHGVSSTGPTCGQRVSLVCEQYTLPPESLAACPYLEVISNVRPAAT